MQDCSVSTDVATTAFMGPTLTLAMNNTLKEEGSPVEGNLTAVHLCNETVHLPCLYCCPLLGGR